MYPQSFFLSDSQSPFSLKIIVKIILNSVLIPSGVTLQKMSRQTCNSPVLDCVSKQIISVLGRQCYLKDNKMSRLPCNRKLCWVGQYLFQCKQEKFSWHFLQKHCGSERVIRVKVRVEKKNKIGFPIHSLRLSESPVSPCMRRPLIW